MTKTNKTKKIEIRCTPEEHAQISALASDQGFSSLSEYARFMLTQKSEGSPQEFRKVVDEAYQLCSEVRQTIRNSGSTIFQATRRLTTITTKGEVIPASDADNTRIALSKAPEALDTYRASIKNIDTIMKTLVIWRGN